MTARSSSATTPAEREDPIAVPKRSKSTAQKRARQAARAGQKYTDALRAEVAARDSASTGPPVEGSGGAEFDEPATQRLAHQGQRLPRPSTPAPRPPPRTP